MGYYKQVSGLVKRKLNINIVRLSIMSSNHEW